MYYIVGLGNPGKEYDHTRHNVGFTVTEAFIGHMHFSSLYDASAYSGRMSKGVIEGNEVSVLLPSTHMNMSGSAVKRLVPATETSQLIVIYDDVDLPLGELKLSFSRGDGGHNGVKSIIESLGTPDFIRVRIGTAQKSMWTGALKRPKGNALASFVLSPFSPKEQKILSEVITKAIEAIHICVTEGKESAMNRFN